MQELAALIDQVLPCFCLSSDNPLIGWERAFRQMMGIRVFLAQHHERDIPKAIKIQRMMIDVEQPEARCALLLPSIEQLSENQKQTIRDFAVRIATLGQLLREKGAVRESLDRYRESLALYQKIDDKPGQAITEGNIGNAYLTLQDLCDYKMAEEAFSRSFSLREINDRIGQSRSLAGIGNSNAKAFGYALMHNMPHDEILGYAQKAMDIMFDALALCPAEAVTDRARIHVNLGIMCSRTDNLDEARNQLEQAIQNFEDAGNRFDAGRARMQMASMNLTISDNQSLPNEQYTYLQRAQAYVQAAMRDFQHYQGRVTNEEVSAQHLLERIARRLAEIAN
jgi:tetratricopeptide (TPR) repeat protein